MREMNKILQEIDDWVDQKYKEIRSTGNRRNEIKKAVKDIACKDPEIADVIKIRLLRKLYEDDAELVVAEEREIELRKKEKKKQVELIVLFLLGWFVGEILVKM